MAGLGAGPSVAQLARLPQAKPTRRAFKFSAPTPPSSSPPTHHPPLPKPNNTDCVLHACTFPLSGSAAVACTKTHSTKRPRSPVLATVRQVVRKPSDLPNQTATRRSDAPKPIDHPSPQPVDSCSICIRAKDTLSHAIPRPNRNHFPTSGVLVVSTAAPTANSSASPCDTVHTTSIPPTTRACVTACLFRPSSAITLPS